MRVPCGEGGEGSSSSGGGGGSAIARRCLPLPFPDGAGAPPGFYCALPPPPPPPPPSLQVETGSAITWKYPSVVLVGDGSVGEFYSVALTNNHQQADTGTKMIHVRAGCGGGAAGGGWGSRGGGCQRTGGGGQCSGGALRSHVLLLLLHTMQLPSLHPPARLHPRTHTAPARPHTLTAHCLQVGRNTRSRIVSKGIAAGASVNAYRGQVSVGPAATGARNYSQCDSMLIGDRAGANTYPYIQVRDPSARVEHEASTSKIGEDQLFYFQQRGVGLEDAVGMIISGFCREVSGVVWCGVVRCGAVRSGRGRLRGDAGSARLDGCADFGCCPACLLVSPPTHTPMPFLLRVAWQVFNELPLEFAAEVNQLMSLKLEGSVG